MRAFDDLTERGRVGRLRRIALSALDDYDLGEFRLRYLDWHTNTIWRVDTADGRRFALRVGSGEHDSATDTATELVWLSSAAEAGLPVVRPVTNRSGSAATPIATNGVPGTRVCVLFEWLPGTPMANHLSPATYRELGRITALLHEHATTFSPPAGFSPLRWDRVFYYPDEPVVWADPVHRRWITPKRRDILERIIQRANARLAQLHAGPTIVLHGDLHPDNVMVHRGDLTVFDFEDVMIGHPIQDIAISRFYERTHPDYDTFCAAYDDGYRSVRPYPDVEDGLIELLMAARTVNFVNYVLRLDPEPGPYVEKVTARLSRYLRRHPD